MLNNRFVVKSFRTIWWIYGFNDLMLDNMIRNVWIEQLWKYGTWLVLDTYMTANCYMTVEFTL